MSENVKRRQEMERRIVRRLLLDAKKLGYTFSVDNGGDVPELPKPTGNIAHILETMFATDDEYLMFYQGDVYVGWVYFIYGNGNGGLDVISDYTVNLEPCMTWVNALIARYE